jgi:Glycosyl hydrolases family 16
LSSCKVHLSIMRTISLSLLCWSCLLGADTQAQVAFKDEFKSGKLDTTKWIIATYQSPDSAPGVNRGTYVSSAIDFTQGMLRITVQQHATARGVESLGGAIFSRELFGFGTYDFEMRMSSLSPTPHGNGTASTGAVSSGFIYYDKSESEIDLEFLGNENAMWVSTWRNPDPNLDPTPLQRTTDKLVEPGLATRFRQYSLVWTAKTVDVYIDGTRVAHQTEHVPHTPAHIILQHRGTNSDKWGGVAAVGVERYFFVRSVKFTPLGAK